MSESHDPTGRPAIHRYLVAAVAAGGLTLGLASGASTARADGAASTRNIILGAAAAVAADIIYNNIHHKNVQHNTIVGRTRDGGTVYADGRVVYPNGETLYSGNGGSRCSFDGSYAPCGGRPVVYYPRGYSGSPHGNDYDGARGGGHAYGRRDRDDRGHHDDRGDGGDDRGGHGDH